MIKTVFFDLDNTILDFNRAERLALTRTLDEMGIDASEKVLVRYSEINLSQWKRLERGEIDRTEVKRGRYRLLFDEMHIDADETQAARIYEKYLSQGHFFIDGAEALLEELYGKYSLYLVSNGTACVQEGRLASAGISRYFENIFISELIGFEKPAAEFFNYCFERIPGFSRETAAIVGDSLTSDMLGGQRSGIKTVWFNPAGSKCTLGAAPDRTAAALSEIPEILKEL